MERYFCTVCHRGQPTPGDCPDCADEPLIDLSSDLNRADLESMDSAAARRRFMQGIFIGLPVSILLVFFVFGVAVDAQSAGKDFDGGGLFIAAAGLTAVIAWGVTKVWPAHRTLPTFTPEQIEALDAIAAADDDAT